MVGSHVSGADASWRAPDGVLQALISKARDTKAFAVHRLCHRPARTFPMPDSIPGQRSGRTSPVRDSFVQASMLPLVELPDALADVQGLLAERRLTSQPPVDTVRM